VALRTLGLPGCPLNQAPASLPYHASRTPCPWRNELPRIRHRPGVALEIILLCSVQYVAGCVQPDDCAVAREVLRVERAGVFGCVDGEPILLSEFLYSGDPDSDGGVAESCRLGETSTRGCWLRAAIGTETEASRSAARRFVACAVQDDG